MLPRHCSADETLIKLIRRSRCYNVIVIFSKLIMTRAFIKMYKVYTASIHRVYSSRWHQRWLNLQFLCRPFYPYNQPVLWKLLRRMAVTAVLRLLWWCEQSCGLLRWPEQYLATPKSASLRFVHIIRNMAEKP